MTRTDFAINRKWLAKVSFTIGAIIALCVACGQAKSDTRVGLHLGSYHTSGNWNNFNPGVYVYHNGWTAGTYYNSERSQSAYAGYTFEGALVGPFSYGLTVGAITGYARARVLPMVVPSVSFHATERASARLSFIPPFEKNGAAVFHLSVEYRFN